jgi:Nif-specific regulatory protein
MSRLRIEILSGSAAGKAFASDEDVVHVGRAPHNHVSLPDKLVSAEHARIVIGADRVLLEDLRSTNGTSVLRNGQRIPLSEEQSLRAALEPGDVVELGGHGDGATSFRVSLDDEREGHVVSVRPLAELPGRTPSRERDSAILERICALQKSIGAAAELDAVIAAIADAALELVPTATHATVLLRDEPEDGTGDDAASYVPVLTRVRGPSGRATPPGGPVPVTRSVARKVIRERAAVLATDAPTEAFSSESLLGASIQSTIGVPLAKGAEILGVLQLDSRGAPALFESSDVDALGVLAATASLAVANARLIRRLSTAEERLEKENRFLKDSAKHKKSEILGRSRAIRDVLGQLEKVADTRVSVLVEGETGTGKELVASFLHYRSRRRDKLFVAQNCAALPETLLESELFGHKRGAFTGATEEKKGLFEIADGGTLFLDEVTEMPLGLQAKILRVLQEGEVRPIGATATRHVNVRIVAATNRDLEKETKAGRFREDLYYRLKVFPIRVPPLRERREDVALLAAHFLERYSREIGKPIAGFAQETTELLAAYEWPGNVRELENEVQRLVIQADAGTFVAPDLLSSRVRQVEGVVTQAGASKGTLKEMVEQVEKYFVLEALREHSNNKTSAAKALGITREGLHKKLKQLKITS